MNETKIKIPLDLEIWHTEEDKDVLLVSPEQIRIANKKKILQHYLKKISEKVVCLEVEEEQKNKLKSLYKAALEKSKMLASIKGDILQKEIADKDNLKDKRYLEADSEGNLYVSDDI